MVNQEVAPLSMHAKLRPELQIYKISELRDIMALAATTRSINLGPGICEVAPALEVLEAARKALITEAHCYAPIAGVACLRQAIANKYTQDNGISVDADNVMVASGSTGAFESICRSFLIPGDRVVLFEPYYQYHLKQIQTYGAKPQFVPLVPPDWKIDFSALAETLAKRPKLLVIVNPHNPTGKAFTKEELKQIAALCVDFDVTPVCDEVYEYFAPANSRHISLASLPGMFARSLTISSASKTFCVPGWRVGWAIGPAEVLRCLMIASDEIYLCAPSPLQHAVAECLTFGPEFFAGITTRFEQKRLKLWDSVTNAGLTPLGVRGGAGFYFLADYSSLRCASDLEATLALINTCRVATVPGSAFYGEGNSGTIRFCCAVEDELLEQACERLECLQSTARFHDCY